MPSPVSPERPDRGRARVLHQLRERLEGAESLALEMRRGLARGDAAAIEAATARLESLVLEYKLLAREYGELPAATDAGDAALRDARHELERAATRVARSSAVAGGLLERMVAMVRGLLAALDRDGGDAYTSDGRFTDPRSKGIRLTESA